MFKTREQTLSTRQNTVIFLKFSEKSFFFFWQFRFSGNASCNICLVICNSEITMLWSKGYDWNSMSICQMFEWNVMRYYICQNVQHLTESIAWNAIRLITDSSVKLITEFNLGMYVQKQISCRFLHTKICSYLHCMSMN